MELEKVLLFILFYKYIIVHKILELIAQLGGSEMKGEDFGGKKIGKEA